MLAGATIAWSSKRQPVTAFSSPESEFYSMLHIAQDNNVCIFLVKRSGMYARAKHINTRVHRVWEFASDDSLG